MRYKLKHVERCLVLHATEQCQCMPPPPPSLLALPRRRLFSVPSGLSIPLPSDQRRDRGSEGPRGKKAALTRRAPLPAAAAKAEKKARACPPSSKRFLLQLFFCIFRSIWSRGAGIIE